MVTAERKIEATALTTACPICNTTETRALVTGAHDYFVANGASPEFGVRFCPRCDLGFSTPALSDAELAAYYPPQYEAYHAKPPFLRLLQDRKYISDLKLIERYAGRRKLSLFEIGCGNGEFLAAAQRRGMRVAGAEPSAAGRAYAQSRLGLTLEAKFASDIHFTERYDVAVARHSLEHVNDGRGCLEEIHAHGLAPGGLLFLKIPRLDSWEPRVFGGFWSGYDLPRHRVHFSAAGIGKLLRDVGFTDIQTIPEVVPTDLSRSIEYYGRHGDLRLLSALSRSFACLPGPVRLVAAQSGAITLSFLGAGRMIVFARRPS
jgi:SAM-dependent methyltransferase